MFASWLGPQEIAILGGCFFFVAVPVVVLVLVLRVLRPRRVIEPDDASPLERAHRAAAALTPEEREFLRRSREPPPTSSGDKGITS